MPNLSKISQEKLNTCHEDIQRIIAEVIKYYDLTVVCGHRGEAEQEDVFRKGNSKLRFPKSKHNTFPSTAIDVVPYPIDWNDKHRFFHFAGYVQGVANQLGIAIRWGGDWSMDNNFKNDSFTDMPHFQLVGEKYANVK